MCNIVLYDCRLLPQKVRPPSQTTTSSLISVKQCNFPAEVTYCQCNVPQASTSVPGLTPSPGPWEESRGHNDNVTCDTVHKLYTFGRYVAKMSGKVKCEDERETPYLISYKIFEQIILQFCELLSASAMVRMGERR